MKKIIAKILMNLKKYRKIIVLCLSIKIALLLFLFFGQHLISFDQGYFWQAYQFNGPLSSFAKGLSAWDGQLYLEIAKNGYKSYQSYPGLLIYAFFPLYPIFMRLFSYLFSGNLVFAGVFLNFIFSLLGCIYFYELVGLDEERGVAKKSVFYFLIFPAAIFYLATYPEPLLLFLILASFYYARKRNFWAAAVFGFFAALTKLQGIYLFLPILLEYLIYLKDQKPKNFREIIKKSRGGFLLPLLIPLGTFSFFLFAYFQTGHFFRPLSAQALWGRSSLNLENAVIILYREIVHFNSLPFYGFTASKIDFIFAAVFLALLVPMYKMKIRISYLLFSFFCIFVPLASGSTLSMIRLSSISFPQFIFLAKATKKLPILEVALVLLSLLLLIVLSLKFINGYWVS